MVCMPMSRCFQTTRMKKGGIFSHHRMMLFNFFMELRYKQVQRFMIPL